jgi:hypothetical protein
MGDLHNLYSSPDIIRQIKSRRMRWAGHVARIGEGRKVHRLLWESPKERDHLEDEGALQILAQVSQLYWQSKCFRNSF